MPRFGDCTVCARPDVARIDARYAAEEGLRPIARECGIPASTLRRHWLVCRGSGKAVRPSIAPPAVDAVAPAALAMPAPEPIADGHLAASLRQLEEAHRKLLEAYETAYTQKDGRLLAVLSPQLRANLSAAASLRARSAPPKTDAERLLDHPDFAEAARVVARALEGYPEAREAVRGALEAVVGPVEAPEP